MNDLHPPELPGFPSNVEPTSKERLHFAIECARLAPSGHNRQPWQFWLGEDCVDLIVDHSRSLPIVDPDDRELTISCGVALFYLRLAIRYMGLEDSVEIYPNPLSPDWIARVRLGGPVHRSAEDVQLFQAISRRHTNRLPFLPRSVPLTLSIKLAQAARQEGGFLQLINDGQERATAARLIGEGVHILADNPSFRREMTEWFHPLREGDTDGIAHLSAEIGELLTHSGPLVSAIDGGNLLARQEQLFAAEAPLLAMLGTSGDTRQDWLTAGQTLARVLLLAAGNGVNATYLNQPIQVPCLRPRLKEALNMHIEPQLLLAMGYAPAVSSAPRRSVEEVEIQK